MIRVSPDLRKKGNSGSSPETIWDSCLFASPIMILILQLMYCTYCELKEFIYLIYYVIIPQNFLRHWGTADCDPIIIILTRQFIVQRSVFSCHINAKTDYVFRKFL